MSSDFQVITFYISLAGVLFGVYHYFRNPQIASDKADAIITEKLEALTSKLELLINNDLHEMKGMLDRMSGEFTALAILVGKLETKIDERVPKK